MLIRRAKRAVLLALGLTIFASHAELPPERPLVVAVAANFADTAAYLAARFTEKTGVPVRLIMGSTGLLTAQISQGAPIDLFLAADTERPQSLITKNLVMDQSYAIYARGRLVLWVPGVVEPPNLADFMAGFDTVAIANPVLAPYGRAASEVLARFPEKSQALRVVRGQNTSATYTQIASRSVPGGFVALSQVLAQGVPRVEYMVVPENWHEPIEQAMVLIKGRAIHPAGQPFRDFLLSEKTSVMLSSLGYLVGGG